MNKHTIKKNPLIAQSLYKSAQLLLKIICTSLLIYFPKSWANTFKLEQSIQTNYISKIKESRIEERSYTIDYNREKNQFNITMKSETLGFFSLFRAPYQINIKISLLPEGKSRIELIKENDDGEKSQLIFDYKTHQIQSNELDKPRAFTTYPITGTPETAMISIMHYLNYLIQSKQKTLTGLEQTRIEIYMPYTLYESKEHLGKFFKATYFISKIDDNQHIINFVGTLEKDLIKSTMKNQFQVQYSQHIFPIKGQVEQPKVPLVNYEIQNFKIVKK